MSYQGAIEIVVRVTSDDEPFFAPGVQRIILKGDMYTIQNALKSTSLLTMAQSASRDLNDRIERSKEEDNHASL